jgi:hypothetical protein
MDTNMTQADNSKRPAARLGLKERYAMMTRGLGWDTTYEDMDECFRSTSSRASRSTTGTSGKTPFRLTMDAYWKFQGEKEKKLYAIIDAFQQNNGQFNISDPRYLNTLKLFLTGVSPLEYAAHRGYAMAGDRSAASARAWRARCSRSTSCAMRRPSSTPSATSTSTSTACTTRSTCTTASGTCRCPSRTSRTR